MTLQIAGVLQEIRDQVQVGILTTIDRILPIMLYETEHRKPYGEALSIVCSVVLSYL